jgi:hypothetical protein
LEQDLRILGILISKITWPCERTPSEQLLQSTSGTTSTLLGALN